MKQPSYKIEEAPTYFVFGRQFTSLYDAKRFATTEVLRQTIHKTGTPLVSTPAMSVPTHEKGRRAEATQAEIDNAGQALRAWLVEHVHTLLPVLQEIADAYPPVVSIAVEDKQS